MSKTTDRLRQLAATLTRAEIARRTGIHPSQVSRWTTRAAPDAADQGVEVMELHKRVMRRAKR